MISMSFRWTAHERLVQLLTAHSFIAAGLGVSAVVMILGRPCNCTQRSEEF
jgi:hypothetical protein